MNTLDTYYSVAQSLMNRQLNGWTVTSEERGRVDDCLSPSASNALPMRTGVIMRTLMARIGLRLRLQPA
jgi:hypothetical protein